MDDSILVTIKKMLGVQEDYEHFDTDIIVHTNTSLMTLNQLGIGRDGFSISGRVEKWSDLTEDSTDINAIKTYIYLKVKLPFDPPTNSFTIDAIERQIKELEWRLNEQAERK